MPVIYARAMAVDCSSARETTLMKTGSAKIVPVKLTRKLSKSKKTKAECALVKILEDNFLPNISNLFRTKEKNERFNINK